MQRITPTELDALEAAAVAAGLAPVVVDTHADGWEIREIDIPNTVCWSNHQTPGIPTYLALAANLAPRLVSEIRELQRALATEAEGNSKNCRRADAMKDARDLAHEDAARHRTGRDMDAADHRRELAKRDAEITRLREALERFECPDCKGAMLTGNHVFCLPCESTGMHPDAREALNPTEGLVS